MRFFVFSSFCVGDGGTRYTMVVHGAVLPYASLARSNSTAFTKRKVTHSVALALSGVCGIEANPLPDVGQWRPPPLFQSNKTDIAGGKIHTTVARAALQRHYF